MAAITRQKSADLLNTCESSPRGFQAHTPCHRNTMARRPHSVSPQVHGIQDEN